MLNLWLRITSNMSKSYVDVPQSNKSRQTPNYFFLINNEDIQCCVLTAAKSIHVRLQFIHNEMKMALILNKNQMQSMQRMKVLFAVHLFALNLSQ